MCHYSLNNGGWQDPEIVPFQDLKLSPAAAALHYGLECFEGMICCVVMYCEVYLTHEKPSLS
jgi:hypothetical protein